MYGQFPFNCLFAFSLGDASLFTLIFLLMCTIGWPTVVILGNAVLDIALHYTYYVVAYFHFVLYLGM